MAHKLLNLCDTEISDSYKFLDTENKSGPSNHQFNPSVIPANTN